MAGFIPNPPPFGLVHGNGDRRKGQAPPSAGPGPLLTVCQFFSEKTQISQMEAKILEK
jgi:hypothetical protein